MGLREYRCFGKSPRTEQVANAADSTGRARSSVVEHTLHTGGVASSILAAPTIFSMIWLSSPPGYSASRKTHRVRIAQVRITIPAGARQHDGDGVAGVDENLLDLADLVFVVAALVDDDPVHPPRLAAAKAPGGEAHAHHADAVDGAAVAHDLDGAGRGGAAPPTAGSPSSAQRGQHLKPFPILF